MLDTTMILWAYYIIGCNVVGIKLLQLEKSGNLWKNSVLPVELRPIIIVLVFIIGSLVWPMIVLGFFNKRKGS